MSALNAVTRGGRPRFWKKLARATGKPRRGKMNHLERAYAEYLTVRELRGEILGWKFEEHKLLIAQGSDGDGQAEDERRNKARASIWYTPDFAVQLPDGTIEFHEVKGHWREAARVRIKVAADRHPYRFVAVRNKKRLPRTEWEFEEFTNLDTEVNSSDGEPAEPPAAD